MSCCIVCGRESDVLTGDRMCTSHDNTDSNWPIVNRMFCDFVHRGIEPPRWWSDALDPKRRYWKFPPGSTMSAMSDI